MSGAPIELPPTARHHWATAGTIFGLFSIISGAALLSWALLDWVGFAGFFVRIYIDDIQPLPSVAPFPPLGSRSLPSFASELWRSWWDSTYDDGPARVAVPLLIALILFGPASALGSLAGHPRATRIGAWFTSVLAAVALVCAAVRVEQSWRRCLDHVTGVGYTSYSAQALGAYSASTQAAGTQFLASAAALLVAPALVGAAGARWARSERDAGRSALLPGVMTGSLIVLFALASLGSIANIMLPLVTWRPLGTSRASHRDVMASFVWISAASKGIAVFAVAAMALVLSAMPGGETSRDTDSRRRGPAALMGMGAACLSAGLVAWVLTRGKAYDAAHPLPSWARFEPPYAGALLASRTSCARLRDSPVVELASDGTWFNGVQLATVAKGPPEIEKLLKSGVELWKATSGRSQGFPAIVSFVVTRDSKMQAVLPFLNTARSVGYREVDAWVTRPPRTFTSRTRGTFVEPHPVCRVTARLDGPLPDAGDWASWVEGLDAPPNDE